MAKAALVRTQIKTFPSSGFYVLRSGWDSQSTVLIHSNNISLKLLIQAITTNSTFEHIVTGVTSSPTDCLCIYGRG